MKNRNVFYVATMVVILILSLPSTYGKAAEFPTRSITIISPARPGGLFDTVGRPFASFAEQHLGKPLVMINKPGATMMVGGTIATQAPADGHTLLLSASAMHLALQWEITEGRKPPFTLQDFTALGSFVVTPPVVIVPSNSPWKTLDDLVRDSKAKPGFYAFCSGGLHGNTHVPIEVLMMATGIEARHVPFKGGGPCLANLVGEHVHFASQFPGSSIPLIRGGKLRALAVQGEKRLEGLPDVPTVKELGIDAVFYNWLGLLVRKETPKEIVTKLREVVKKVAHEKAFIKALENQGQEVDYMSGDELGKYWTTELEMIKKIYAELKKKK